MNITDLSKPDKMYPQKNLVLTLYLMVKDQEERSPILPLYSILY